MKQPHGFIYDHLLVCKLIKALYGPKQAPRVWSAMIRDFLNKLSFQKIESDKRLFVSKDKHMFIAVYVDDLLIFGADMNRLKKVKDELIDRFKMTDLGPASHYLDMEIGRDRGSRKVLKKFSIKACSLVATPMEPLVSNSTLP